MRNAIAIGFLVTLFSALHAIAATCPGNVIAQNQFTAPSPAWDSTPAPQSKIAFQGGKATVSILQGNMARVLEDWGSRFGDVNICVTVATVATETPNSQIGSVLFWAVDYNAYYLLQVNGTNGQFAVAQRLPNGQWAYPIGWTASPAIVQGVGKSNALRVQTKGNTATLFINDQQVGTFKGTPPTGGGQAGFQAQAGGIDTIEFSNFVVTSTQSATPLPASAACPGTVVFQDKFPAGDSYMNVQTGPQAQVAVQGGKGEIILQQASYAQSVQYAGNQFGDANICATFNTLPTDKPENQMAGLEFWATDYNNLYTLLVSPTTGQFQFAQKNGGIWTVIVNSTPNPAVLKPMGKENTLRVLTKANGASLYINNQLVESFYATPPAGGGLVGFYAQSDASFTAKETWQVSNLTVAVP